MPAASIKPAALPPCHCEAAGRGNLQYDVTILFAPINIEPGDSHVASLLGMTDLKDSAIHPTGRSRAGCGRVNDPPLQRICGCIRRGGSLTRPRCNDHRRGNDHAAALPPCHCEAAGRGNLQYDVTILFAPINIEPGDSHVASLLGMTDLKDSAIHPTGRSRAGCGRVNDPPLQRICGCIRRGGSLTLPRCNDHRRGNNYAAAPARYFIVPSSSTSMGTAKTRVSRSSSKS